MIELLEKPWLTGFLGLIIVVVLGFFWLQTGRRGALWAALGTLLATIAAMVASQLVVTEQERVKSVLFQAAEAVEHNDLNELLALVHSESTTIRQQAAAELPRYEFAEVKIKSNLEITFDDPEQPTEATAKFNVVVLGSERNGLFKDRRVPRYCEVKFRKDNGEWRVHSYHHDDPREGLLQRKNP